uniref:MFS transporter n=1 Tax=Candidatus Enterococcus testudinis TaxID=1834191 RepID=UPI001C4FB92F|nr:MFS transporter [Enterococcus sp. 8G7_MSG3316]
MEQQPSKHVLTLGLISVFLCGIGFTIIAPVTPFLVAPYVQNPSQQAFIISALTAVYAACVFLAAPILGALSDQIGRRPILILCLFGGGIGYVLFGIGGALWVFFLSRIIEGITGGSISTLYAYFSDSTPPEQRTKYFGWMSAVAGAGTALGPVIGGGLAHFGYAVPMFVGAAVSIANGLYAWFYLPESLPKALRRISSLKDINPFRQFRFVFSHSRIGRIVFTAFLLWIPAGGLQAIFSQFTIDSFDWSPTLIGFMFSIIGIQDILAQSFLMPWLLKQINEQAILRLGIIGEVSGYLFICFSGIFTAPVFFVLGLFLYGIGDAIFAPAYNGSLSKLVTPQEQGKVLGSSQGMQSLARVIGPLIGGQLYVLFAPVAPALMGVAFGLLALFFFRNIQA